MHGNKHVQRPYLIYAGPRLTFKSCKMAFLGDFWKSDSKRSGQEVHALPKG